MLTVVPKPLEPGLTHEEAKESVVSCPKDKKDKKDKKDGKDGKDGKGTVCHDSYMFSCCSCVNPVGGG